jgi:hypothetical protein
MNGFLVFDGPDAVSRFLDAARDRVDAQFRPSARQPVVVFRNLPDHQVGLLRNVAATFGGELQEARQYAAS